MSLQLLNLRTRHLLSPSHLLYHLQIQNYRSIPRRMPFALSRLPRLCKQWKKICMMHQSARSSLKDFSCQQQLATIVIVIMAFHLLLHPLRKFKQRSQRLLSKIFQCLAPMVMVLLHCLGIIRRPLINKIKHLPTALTTYYANSANVMVVLNCQKKTSIYE